jgi:hypothetical protein
MIYRNKSRSVDVAAELNEKRGYPKFYACRGPAVATTSNWTAAARRAGNTEAR